MRRRLAFVLAATALATAIITATPPTDPPRPWTPGTAHAAGDWCRAPLWTAATLLYDDDELNTYARTYIRLRQNPDGICTMTIGYRPDRTHNDHLRCTAGVNTQRIVVNPTSFRGYDAAPVRFGCRPLGDHVVRRFRPHGADRCVSGRAWAVKRVVKDPFEWLPRRCA